MVLLYILNKLFFVEYSIRELAVLILSFVFCIAFNWLFNKIRKAKRARLSSFVHCKTDIFDVNCVKCLWDNAHNAICSALILLDISLADAAFFFKEVFIRE